MQFFLHRRLDGVSNNKDHVEWGAAQEDVTRDAPPMYADAIASPAGGNRPSPREISNELFQQVSHLGRGLMTYSSFKSLFRSFCLFSTLLVSLTERLEFLRKH